MFPPEGPFDGGRFATGLRVNLAQVADVRHFDGHADGDVGQQPAEQPQAVGANVADATHRQEGRADGSAQPCLLYTSRCV